MSDQAPIRKKLAPGELDPDFVVPPLTPQQIDMAKEMIEDLHPITKTGIDVAFPWLCCPLRFMRKCCAKSEEAKMQDRQKAYQQLKDADTSGMNAQEKKLHKMRMAKMAKTNTNEAVHNGADPFLELGFGLTAYRVSLFSIAVTFCIITVLAIPIMKSYGQEELEDEDIKWYQQYTISNLGYSTVQCTSLPLNQRVATLSCPYGNITTIADDQTAFGVTPSDSPLRNACLKKDEYGQAACDNFLTNDQGSNSYVGIKQHFESNCVGRQSCHFDLEDADIMGTLTIEENEESCTDPTAQFFIQFTCEQSALEQEKKYDIIAMTTCIIMFIALFFSRVIIYLQETMQLGKLEQDASTITAGDFTVEMNISEPMWRLFKDKIYKENVIDAGLKEEGGDDLYSPALYLKKHLTDEVGRILTAYLQYKIKELGDTRTPLPGGQPKRQHVEPKEIQFAYNNHQIIECLKKRGTAIAATKWEDVQKFDQEMSELVKSPANFDRFTTPVVAFITFESDDGANMALEYSKYKKWYQAADPKDVMETFQRELILGEKVDFIAATEPTNIQWENRHIKGINYAGRLFAAILVVLFVLAISFVTIVAFKVKSIKQNEKYPSVNSTAIEEIFIQNQTIEGVEQNFTKLQFAAGLEWLDQEEFDLKEETDTLDVDEETGEIVEVRPELNGPWQAFCDGQKKEGGSKWYSQYLYKANYTIKNGTDIVPAPICEKYTEDKLQLSLLDNIIKYVIIIINTVLRMVIIKIIDKVGLDTQSKEMVFVTNAVFLATIFNTGFLLMIVNANLTQQGFPFPALTGSLSDFNESWFLTMGETITASLIFGIWFPIVMEIINKFRRSLARGLDYCRRGENTTTKTKTLQEYINLFSGPEYFMHYKYSSILNITFLAMIYGAGMPVLFPIAGATLGILFMLEKFMIYYVYKAPPAYDEKLNNSVLHMMSFAPLFLLSFGYWMLSNHQLIENDHLKPLENSNDVFQAEHYWYMSFTPDGFKDSGPAATLLIVFIMYGSFITFGKPIRAAFVFIARCFNDDAFKGIDDIELDEDIDLYQNCLDGEDRQWSIMEEENMRKFGMTTMLQETMDDIKSRNTEPGKFHLKGVHTYDLLRNPLYQQAFQYFSADLDDRKEYIVDGDDDDTNDCAQSDLVRIVLNLAFLTEDDVKNMTFDAAGLHRLQNQNHKKAGIN